MLFKSIHLIQSSLLGYFIKMITNIYGYNIMSDGILTHNTHFMEEVLIF